MNVICVLKVWNTNLNQTLDVTEHVTAVKETICINNATKAEQANETQCLSSVCYCIKNTNAQSEDLNAEQ